MVKSSIPRKTVLESVSATDKMAERKKHRIYTRRGDLGETSLTVGPRVGKDQIRIAACGELDELNSLLGLIRTGSLDPEVSEIILAVQKKIFKVNTEITTFSPVKYEIPTVNEEDIKELEDWIDSVDSLLESVKGFIVPGGSLSGARLHLARAVCRRAERKMVALIRKDVTVSRYVVSWINRLGDLLFVLARRENMRAGITETIPS